MPWALYTLRPAVNRNTGWVRIFLEISQCGSLQKICIWDAHNSQNKFHGMRVFDWPPVCPQNHKTGHVYYICDVRKIFWFLSPSPFVHIVWYRAHTTFIAFVQLPLTTPLCVDVIHTAVLASKGLFFKCLRDNWMREQSNDKIPEIPHQSYFGEPCDSRWVCHFAILSPLCYKLACFQVLTLVTSVFVVALVSSKPSHSNEIKGQTLSQSANKELSVLQVKALTSGGNTYQEGKNPSNDNTETQRHEIRKRAIPVPVRFPFRYASCKFAGKVLIPKATLLVYGKFGKALFPIQAKAIKTLCPVFGLLLP